MSAPILVADVGLDARTAGSEAVYTYRADDSVRVGQARFVPLGARRVLGYVLAVRETDPRSLDFDPGLLKPVGEPVTGLDLPAPTVRLVHEVSRQTLTPVSVALGLAAPPGIRERIVTSWRRTGEPSAVKPTAAQAEALRILEAGPIVENRSKRLDRGALSTLRALEKRGLVERHVALSRPATRARTEGAFRLTPDEDRVRQFLEGPGRRRPAQAVTLMRLQEADSSAFSLGDLRALGGVTDATVKALVDAGLVVRVEEGRPTREPPVPNAAQSAAIDAVTAAVERGEASRFLLFGVTGSGKTEVYLRAAAEALRQGRQVLYLVPEIALTAQVIAQLRERFGHRVALLHSNMSPGERIESWIRIRSGEAPVVLGARSALFAPFTDLGLIVMDEEHEASYKQESAPRYHGRRVGEALSLEFKCPLVLGSATPSVETFHAAQTGEAALLRLPQRAAQARLPDVVVEDLTEQYRAHRPSVFSPRLREGLARVLGRGEQAILFLNRRAYSPFLACRDCGHRFTCPQCAVALAFHRRDRRLRCHQCGHHVAAPAACPQCEGTRVAPFGIGTEKVEEAVTTEFPSARVARLDRDATRRKGALEETLAQFRGREIDVLVGTQMVAKGLDFPNVTLVGVISADMSLNIPDFRGGERTFQLLSQVAGRAGRGERPGEVVIQTLNPRHVAVACAQSHDYEGFFAAVIAERRAAGYPPFVRLVNVLVTGEDQAAVHRVSQEAGAALRAGLGEEPVLGPVDCAIERIQNLWRRHLLIKLAVEDDPARVRELLQGVRAAKVRLNIDVDPYSLL